MSLTQAQKLAHPDIVRALVCHPAFFRVKYSINSWMERTLKDKEQKVNKLRAFEQWMELIFILRKIGIRTHYIIPMANFPDMVFTANSGFFYKDKMLLSNFMHKERRGESLYFRNYFQKELKYPVVAVPFPDGNSRATPQILDATLGSLPKIDEPSYFEGQGDISWYGNNLLCGHGMRSTKEGIVSALESIGFKGMHIPIELVDENFYHLDTCFCVLGNDILWYPKAFGGTSKSMIRNLCVENHSIEVSDEDADNFVCNGIYFALRGRRYLITSPMSDKLRIRLEEIGIEVYENDISEFKKAGGGNKCLVFLF